MQADDWGREVLSMREEEGVRGVKREWSRYRLHIQPFFADRELESFESTDIMDWQREMKKKLCADLRGERTLSHPTIERSRALLSVIFETAKERRLIEKNPCMGVRLKKTADSRSTRDTWAFLSLEEQSRIAVCEDIPLADRLAIRCAIAWGLRQGEQFNLELIDLHVDGPEPHVHVRYGSRGRKPPKSGKTRKVPLFGDGLVAAREWLALLPSYAPENPEGLVFPTRLGRRRAEGKPLGRSAVWHDYVKRAGIAKHVRWHDLRHTCATNLVTGVLGRRWSLEEIQPLMGHSSINITQRYAHVGEDALKRAAMETVSASSQMVVAGEEEVPPSVIRRIADRVLALLQTRAA